MEKHNGLKALLPSQEIYCCTVNFIRSANVQEKVSFIERLADYIITPEQEVLLQFISAKSEDEKHLISLVCLHYNEELQNKPFNIVLKLIGQAEPAVYEIYFVR